MMNVLHKENSNKMHLYINLCTRYWHILQLQDLTAEIYDLF